MKTPTTKLMFAAVAAAIGLTAMAETTNTVKVTKFHQSYPYSGWATVEYTVGGALPANAMADITLSTDDKSATFRQRGVVEGANTNEIEFASSFGGALVLTNASFVLTVEEASLKSTPWIHYPEPSAVQLWDGGPYWAEWNLGATSPVEYGNYYWWGDVVGFKWNSQYDFVSADGSINGFDFNSGCISMLPWGENIHRGNDAATWQLGPDWRTPTDQDFFPFFHICTITWVTTNDVHGIPVNGILVTGIGDYADRSIFLPAGGNGSGQQERNYSDGHYWTSTPAPASRIQSNAFGFGTAPCYGEDHIGLDYSQNRWHGYFIRPVRDSAE